MHALEIEPAKRPASVGDWITELEEAAADVDEKKRSGTSRLVVLGPVNSEVYVNDERKGSIGSSGRVVLTDIPAGRHILRVSKSGDRDDERGSHDDGGRTDASWHRDADHRKVLLR